ncbi:tetratricopeptide repeat-containing hybrid sensor histidine kinase/response regulator [Mangrovimonas spongiae]|uniref:histidine kinase n=1 Tax=Mangrovimonas spongiae TaxID=2494697 RepID=A0A3R9NPF8_9FLAO|nr:ATP-binding protein [Mangrovimonas spongiae]RSK38669.1 response regulator [Mangrovimonas spongiae]
MATFTRILIVVLGLITIQIPKAYGQVKNADSLYTVWKNKNNHDYERIKAFYTRLATPEEMPTAELNKWMADTEEGLEIAKRLNAKEYLGFFYLLNGGRLIMRESNQELGCSYYEKGLRIAEKQEDYLILLLALPIISDSYCPKFPDSKLLEIIDRIKPKIKNHIGLWESAKAYFYKDDSNQAEQYCNLLKASYSKSVKEQVYMVAFKAISEMITANCFDYSIEDINELLLPIENNKDDKVSLTTSLREVYYQLLQNYYYEKNEFPEALKAAQKIIQLSKELGLYDDKYFLALVNSGHIHNEIGNYPEAENYFLDALKLSRTMDNLNYIGQNYMGLANLYVNKKQQILAETYLDSAIYIMRDVKECEPCFALARVERAGLNNLKNNHQEALNELKDLQQNFFGPQQLNNNMAHFYTELGKAYLGLKQYSNAIEVSKTGLTSKAFMMLSKKAELHYILYQAEEQLGRYRSALSDYKKHITYKDSLTVLRNSEETTRLELESQFAQERLADSLQVAQQKLETELTFQNKLNKQKATKDLLIVLGIGALLFAIGLFYRLRYIKKTEKALKQKNEIIEAEKEKAQASERAKHQFLANMSHEIRTPLNAIKGMTDILLRRKPRKDQTEYLDGIKQSSDSLLVIVNDILDISKIEAGKIELEHEPFSIKKVVNNVQTIMHFKAEEKGLQLKTNLPQHELMVKGDDIRLKQILINLIGNAIKFTEKGMVTTTMTSKTEDGKLNLHFTVSDTGIGIEQDRLEKIFKSFEQAYSDTTRKFGGTGLGLSISQKLVELHNGKIWVESEKGKGSQFHFMIPYNVAENMSTEKKSLKTSENNISEQLKGIKVLLVEDNQFNAVVAEEELEDAIENVTVDVAENGTIALEKVESDNYDVVLMDVQMPVMNGYQATEKIRALSNEKANVPIIAMTANVLKEEVDKCYEAGMDDFIGKPFDTTELIQKIHKLTKK